MNIIKLHITLLLLTIWSFSYAQQYTNYNTKNGLPSNHVYRITQDNQGFIWFITDKGMVKYNGSKFKIFNTKNGLPTNDIWDIRNTPDNKVWYFTKTTKLGYIKNDSVFAFESDIKNRIMFPMVISQVGNQVLFLDGSNSFQLKNNKWNAAITGIQEMVLHKKVKHFKITKQSKSLEIFNHKNVLIKTVKAPKEIKTYHHRTQLNDSLFSWVGNNGYSILNLNTLQLKAYIFKNNNTTFSSKFVRFNTANNQIQLSGLDFVGFLDKNNELKNITEIPKHLNAHYSFIDKYENLWIATYSNGVYFLPKAKRNALILLEKEKVGRLQTVDGNLIASVYNKGFYKYNSKTKKFNIFIKEEDFIFEAVKIDTLNTAFYIANKNIYKINIQTKYTYKSYNEKSSFDETPKSLVYYKGSLYGKTSFGLVKVDTENLTIKKEYKQFGIRKLLDFKNQLIIATSNGLKILKDEKITTLKSDVLKKPLLNIAKTKNNIIVCTDGFGAYITDLENTYLLEKSDYLSVQSALVRNNEIWLATNNGILHYKKTGNSYNLIKNYTINDGLSTDLTNSTAIIDKDLIVSSNDGVSIIPMHQSKSSSFLDLYFDKIAYNNEPLKNSNATYTTNNNLDISVSTIDFSENNTLNYSYLLKPIQKQWTSTTSKQINFNNLPPNKYQLNIKAKGKNKTVNFTIKPLWYQKLGFRIIAGLLAFSALFYFIWSINKRQQKKKEEKLIHEKQVSEIQLKALRSQMNPHFVFNSLAAIQYYINDNNFEDSEKYLIKFSKLIRQFFELSKEEKISVDAEIKLLKNYLDVETFRFREKLNYNIHIDSQLAVKEVEIPTMLLQPIVENAVNHGIFNKLENGLVTINFIYIDNQTFKIEIIDDGVGFVNTKKKSFKKVKSTNVLEDRIHFLNQSKNWNITYKTAEMYPELEDKGNKSTFVIKKNRQKT